MPPSNPTPPPGGGGTQKLSLDHESLQVLRDLIAATKGSTQVTQRTSRTTAKAVDQQVVEARQSRQATPKLKPPPKSFEQEVGEGIAAHQKRLALRSAVGLAINPPKTFDQQVQHAVESKRSRQSFNDAVSAHFKPIPTPAKSFEQQVGEGIAARQKRQSLNDAVNAHFNPPKTFEQQVQHTVAARQQSKALNDAVEAQINPPKSFKEQVQHAVAARQDSRKFNAAVERSDPWAAGIASRFAAPVAAGAFGINAAATAQRLVDNPYMGRAAASREYIKSMPGGETVLGWADSFTGRERKVQGHRRDVHENVERGAIQLDRIAFDAGFNPTRAGLSAAASTRRHQAPALHPVMDRSSASGEHSYQIAMKLLPLKQETLRTEIAMKKASAETAAAEFSAAEIAAKREAIEFRMNTHRMKRDRHSAADSEQEQFHMDMVESMQKQRDALRPMEDSANRTVFEKRAAEAGAKGEHYKASSREELIGQAEVFQDQADRAKSGAARIGSMNPLEREMALQAAQIGKEHGLDALSPEMKAQFAAIAPKEYEAAAVNAGMNSRAYSELQKSGFVDFPGAPGTKPGALQLAADSKRMESGAADFANDKGVDAALEAGAEKMANAFKTFTERLVDRVVAKVEDKMRMGK